MINLTTTVSALLVSVAMFALSGCAVGAGEPSDTSSTSEAIISTGGGSQSSLGFDCSGGACICYGDEDCNNLFGSGKCDGKNSTCWTRGPTQYCTCYPKSAAAPAPAPASTTVAHTTTTNKLSK